MSVLSKHARGRRAIFCLLAGATVLALSLTSSSAPGAAAPRTAGSLSATPTTTTAGQPVTLKGKVPPRKRRPILLQRKAGHSWVTLARKRTSRTGTFTFTTRPRATTTYRVLAPRRTIGGRSYAAVQTPHRTVTTRTQQPPDPTEPFVTAVSDNGRYFVDQNGDPILVKGDSPWAILVDATPKEMTDYLETRAAQGFNVVLCSLLGNTVNGGPFDNGNTFDGVSPFVGGDPSELNDAYWDRVDHFITTAASLGITVMAYPIDGWTGVAENNGLAASWNTTTATNYGKAVGTRLDSHPNLIWATGGDFPNVNGFGDDDPRFWAVFQGIDSVTDYRPRTIQFTLNTTSLESTYWDEKVDFNFVYSYAISYAMVEGAYGETNPSGDHIPALLSEPHYEGYALITPLYIRSMAAWALTSGSPGEFYGSEEVWDTAPTPEALNTDAVDQLSAMRAAFEALDGWENLVPDYNSAFVVNGRGTKGDESTEYFSGNTYVTGARTPDGTLAVVYLPDANREITINEALMDDGYTARWVDPTTGIGPGADEGPTYRRTAPNAAGDTDWLLVLESD
jgi:hypothetical protein